MMPPTIVTDRLIIRPQQLEDFEPYAAAWADPEMTRYIGGNPRDRTTSWGKFLQGTGMWDVLGHGYWSFIERRTERWVGTGGLAKFERGVADLENHVEAGWAFAPYGWGKGYASEVVRAIMVWADEQSISEVRAIIDHANLDSARVAEKCGFSRIVETIPEFPESALWQRVALAITNR
jgi:RimJ/RimL family protein N-acetyltransferase